MKRPVASAMKLEPFECGATPIEQVNVKAVPVKYYAIAIVFILFDLETVFLFLWALGAQPLTGGLLVALGVFMVLLVVIMLYVWRTGLLEEVIFRGLMQTAFVKGLGKIAGLLYVSIVFAVLHLGVLMLGSSSVSPISIVYLIGLMLALVVLIIG